MLRGLFFDPKRYDLSKVGRHKLNTRLHGHRSQDERPAADVRVLTVDDIVELIRRLIALPPRLGVPDDAKDYAAEAVQLLATRREDIADEIDEYEDFGNRRLRTVGELVQDAFRVGLARMERVIKERLTTEDPDTIVPATLVNIRPVVAALKEFFGSSQLSQFMDQTNSLSGLTHRRRLSALGSGGLTRERAPIEVRDVHTTHYGRMCPIETPEGPNIGLIGSLASFATVDEFGFIRSPYRKVVKGKVTDEIVYLDASEEEARSSTPRPRKSVPWSSPRPTPHSTPRPASSRPTRSSRVRAAEPTSSRSRPTRSTTWTSTPRRSCRSRPRSSRSSSTTTPTAPSWAPTCSARPCRWSAPRRPT